MSNLDGCLHHNAVKKRYVGSQQEYWYCPDCIKVWGGEECREKEALIDAACRAEVTEQMEVEGYAPSRPRGE